MLVTGKQAVKRINRGVAESAVELLLHAPYLSLARQESQDVTLLFVMGLQDGIGDKPDNIGCICLFSSIFQLDGECPAFALQNGTMQGVRQHGRIDSSRHHHQAQVFAQQLLALACQGKRLVSIQAPLMKLVEDHHCHTFQRRVIQQHAG